MPRKFGGRCKLLAYKRSTRQIQICHKMVSKICPVILSSPVCRWSAIKSPASQVQNIDDLCKYYKDTRLNGSFPIASWNHNATEGQRTNNHVEGWHKKLNVAAGKTQPNVFETIEVFQAEQANVGRLYGFTITLRLF